MSRSRLEPTSWLVAGVALLSLTLLRLPTLYGGTLHRLLLLVPFLLCIGWAGVRRDGGPRVNRVAMAVVALFTLLLVVAMFRGLRAGVYGTTKPVVLDAITLVVAVWFSVWLMASARSDEERWFRVVAIALSPAALMAVNALLHFRGYTPPGGETSVAAGDQAQLLGFLGIGQTRTQFPLSQSINNYGVVMAAGFAAASTLFLLVRTPSRWVTGTAALLCLYGVLMSDSRGPLVMAVGATLVVIYLPRVRLSILLAVAVPLSPLIVAFVLGVLSDTSAVGALSRSGNDLVSGTGRIFIWEASWHVLRDFRFEHLIGFGAGGQTTSGATLGYAWMFPGLADPFSAHTHNLAIQTIFDIGYLGLAVLVAVVVSTAMALEGLRRTSPGSPAGALLAAMAVMVLAGSTESAPTLVSREAIAYLLLVAGMGTALGGALPEPRRERADRRAPAPSPAPSPARIRARTPARAASG